MFSKIFIIILVNVFLFVSCSSLQVWDSKPSATISEVKWDSLDLQQANMIFFIRISNPYSVPLPLTNLEYSLAANKNIFLSGKANDLQGTIPPQDNKVIPLPVSIKFLETLQLLSNLKPGSLVPYTAHVNLSVDAPGIGNISLPLQKEGEFPIPTVPEVSLQQIHWQEMNFTKATAVLHLQVKNLNVFPMEMTELDYALKLSGISVVKEEITKTTSFKGGEENIIQIPITVLPINLGRAAFNVFKGSSATYNIEGKMIWETPFGSLNLPLQSSGSTPFKAGGKE